MSSSKAAAAGGGGSAAPLAAALESGQAVVLPIEGGYVAAARADGAGGPARTLVSRLAALAVWSPGEFWLAPEAGACEAALGAAAPGGHRRLVRRLTPGPAIFLAGKGTGGFRPRTEKEGAGAGGGPEFRAAMCTGSPVALAALARLTIPVFAAEILGDDRRPAEDLESALAAVRALGGQKLAVAGPDPGARPVGRTPPTVIELLGTGGEAAGSREPAGDPGYVVRRAGAYEDRFIRKQMGLTVLFVCTGNTCRSPMAEAIASTLAARSGSAGGPEIRFTSAGTAAASGGPPSPEGIAALRELGIGGGGAGGGGGAAALSGHRSRALTRRLIEEADIIYTMGRSHLHAVLELAPDAEGRVQTLDPDGGDVPDPIGMSQEVYVTTARRIMDMVRQRLKELGL